MSGVNRETMRKKILIIGWFCAIAAAAAGCGKTDAVVTDAAQRADALGETDAADAGQPEGETASADAEQTGDEAVDADTAREESEAAADAKAAEAEDGTDPASAQDALAFVRDMKLGWNLGNTFDAYTDTNKADELSYETEWSKAVTTKEMIDAVKAAGFETIRIPVSWHNHVTDDGSYRISEVWLDRVQEVVDYAIDNDMYVIINIHHDNSVNYMYPAIGYLEQSEAYVAAIWFQVATRFADYDEHLLMEGLNEPRLVGTANEWWLDMEKPECFEAVQCINELNQVFVDTVRAAGGRNESRYLLVPGYAASLQGAANEYFVLPQDIEGNSDKILVEVHGYIPNNFALQAAGEAGSTDQWSPDSGESTAEIDNMMDTLYEKYVKNGVGVVIDEFGARDKGGNLQARADYASYYVAAARERGITCCWWDNNSFSGGSENFGLFDRASCRFMYPELVEGMMTACE